MDRVAEGYVKLVLAMGAHDADYVDAYYGPSEWKTEAAAAKLGLDAIASRAATLLADLGRTAPGGDEMATLRRQYLERQLSALAARVRILKGERLTFDQESKALYDAVAPTYPETHFQILVARAALSRKSARDALRGTWGCDSACQARQSSNWLSRRAANDGVTSSCRLLNSSVEHVKNKCGAANRTRAGSGA